MATDHHSLEGRRLLRRSLRYEAMRERAEHMHLLPPDGPAPGRSSTCNSGTIEGEETAADMNCAGAAGLPVATPSRHPEWNGVLGPGCMR